MTEDERLFLGLDVGGTKCAVVIGTAEGDIVHRTEFPTAAARGPDAVLADLLAAVNPLLARHLGVVAAGVSVGGPLDAARGVILSPPNLPGWDRVPLADLLSRELAIPVAVEHDATACALAEHRWGAGAGATRLAYLTCGTGFGVGLVFDGRPYRGAGGRPSDFGHMRYRADGPDVYGKPGSLEGYAAGSAPARLARWRHPDAFGPDTSTKDIAAAAARGDARAQSLLEETADAVGYACAVLADLLYLDAIVLGSAALYLGDTWVTRTRARFVAEALPAAANGCRVVRSALGARLQDLSALVPAIDVADRQLR